MTFFFVYCSFQLSIFPCLLISTAAGNGNASREWSALDFSLLLYFGGLTCRFVKKKMEVRADEKWKEGGENTRECFFPMWSVGVECWRRQGRGWGLKFGMGWGCKPAHVLRDLRVCGGSSFERLSTDLHCCSHSTAHINAISKHTCPSHHHHLCFYMFLTRCKIILKTNQ